MNPKISSINYGRHEVSQEDIDAVVDTLKSDYLTQGPKVEEFETKFAEYIGSKYAVAVSNGTAALHISALALGVKKGKKVITSPLSFVATSNAVLYCGGEIEFCDINNKTLILDINQVRKKIESQPKGTYDGIIPIDFAGYPVQMEEFRDIADEHKLWLLEDSCHAPGGTFYDSIGKLQNCGNGNFAELAIFSFHPVKHIACGEGGMITTNDQILYNKLLLLRSHGINKNIGQLAENHGGWYYEMQDLGFNYRMSDINAALGISQLTKANINLQKRKKIAKDYDLAFKDLKSINLIDSVAGHAYHLYIIQVKERNELYEYLKKENIFTQVHYIPIHLQPYYRAMGWKKGMFPVVEEYYSKTLSLPIYPSLPNLEQKRIIDLIRCFYSNE